MGCAEGGSGGRSPSDHGCWDPTPTGPIRASSPRLDRSSSIQPGRTDPGARPGRALQMRRLSGSFSVWQAGFLSEAWIWVSWRWAEARPRYRLAGPAGMAGSTISKNRTVVVKPTKPLPWAGRLCFGYCDFRERFDFSCQVGRVPRWRGRSPESGSSVWGRVYPEEESSLAFHSVEVPAGG